MEKLIIALSGKQFSGKDTVAKILLEQLPHFKRIALGDAIKLEYGKLHNLTYEQIEKDKPLYRQGLIELGNWGRAQDKDFWINKIIDLPENIIVPDVRMQREFDIFKSKGAFLIRVDSTAENRGTRGTLVKQDDPTECQLDSERGFDCFIENNATYEELKNTSLKMLAQNLSRFGI